MDQAENKCPVSCTMRIIGGKKKPIFLWLLCNGARHCSELGRMIPIATQKILTRHLRDAKARFVGAGRLGAVTNCR